MTPHRHRRQRPLHRFRYGFAHWRKHARHEQHNHRVRQPTEAAQDSTSVSTDRTTYERVQLGRRQKAFRVGGIVVGFILIVLLLATGLAFLTYRHVRSPLESVQNTLTEIAHDTNALNSASGRKETEVRLVDASREITSAKNQIDGSVGLKVLGVVPVLHTQKVGLDQLVADLQTTTVSALSLLRSVDTLAAESHGTDISLPGLEKLGTLFASTHTQMKLADRGAGGLWGPLGRYRNKFDREDVRAVHLLSQGEDATRFAREFLGGDGPRDYLVIGENNAEMRDEGITLSYSLMHTRKGEITETPGGSVDGIEPDSPTPGVSVPAGTEAVFGDLDPTELWQSTNATADFSFSARDMQYMLAYTTGTDVDGVVGVDVVALQALLKLTGPVTVPGIPEAITAQNAANVLLNQLYAGLLPDSDQGPRREEIAEVASAVFHQLGVAKVDVVALARTLATETAERHLQVWDDQPKYERTISELGASGNIDTDDPTRTFHVAVENATATKLDYYVDVAVSDTVSVAPDGSATVITSVKLTNNAPAGQPASYQLGPDGPNTSIPGEYIGRVFLWSPRGSKVSGSVKESGLLLANEVDLTVLPGQSATTQFETTIPHAIQDNKLNLVFVPQPRLAPETIRVHVVASGTQATAATPLRKTTTLTWEFERS